jgi:hypothetical protein
MRHLASLATSLALVSGCVFTIDGRGEQCDLPPIALAPQLDPETLTCITPRPECTPGCVCDDGAPSRTWGLCDGRCNAVTEEACTAIPGCRVVKDARCAISGACETDFLTCAPTDQVTEPSLDCLAAGDAETCSRSAACTAFHFDRSPEIRRVFAMCAPAGTSPGACAGEVTCELDPPGCPPDRRPGVANGCYTGVCIPVELCDPAPPT